MRKEKNEAEESRLKLEGRLAQLEGEMEESDGQLKMYITKIHDLKKTNKQLEAEVSRNKTDIENASDTKLAVENARSQLAELKLKVRSQEVEITGLKEEKGKCRAEIKSLKHRLEHDVQARFEEMKNEYQSKINNLQKDIGTLNSKLMQEQHRNAEMSAIMDNSPQMTEHEIDMFRKKERELRATVAKLIVNEEASEASFTCFTCMDVFTDPVTCIPCGHSYCLKCIESAGKCVQCKDGSGGNVQYYKNELLDDLATRYSFRKQALASIKDMTAEKYSASKK